MKKEMEINQEKEKNDENMKEKKFGGLKINFLFLKYNRNNIQNC